MNRDIYKYGIVALVALITIVFFYPTIYRYDKLNQEYPVKINRFTGKTFVLTGLVWEEVESPKKTADSTPKQSEMDNFEKEMEAKFEGVKLEIESNVSKRLKNETMDSMKSDVEEAKATIKNYLDTALSEINEYKLSQTDPNNSFTIGSTKDEVKKIMGPPTSTSNFSNSIVWFYGTSYITFVSGKVTEYTNTSGELRIK